MHRAVSARTAARVAAVLAAAVVTATARAEVEDFAGHYAGTYATSNPDAQRGTWCAIADRDGRVDGYIHSDVTGGDYALSGTVSDSGDIALSTGDTTDDSSFEGSVAADGRVAGIWWAQRAPDQFNGTFEGEHVSTPSPPCGGPSA